MPAHPFPPTRRSIVEAAASSDPAVRERAFNALTRVYWRPVCAYATHAWRLTEADAEDLTQELFTRAFTRGFFDAYDPARARFRTFMRVCTDRLAANRRRDARRLKRGGGVQVLPLEVETDDGPVERPLPGGEDPEAWFRAEWARSLMAAAVDRVRIECEERGHTVRFTVFARYDLEGPDRPDRPSYAELAEDLGISTAQVTNYLHGMRKVFRTAVLDTLREMSGSEAEFRAEARDLLGIEVEPA